MGLHIIDVLLTILSFGGFKQQSIKGKIVWILLYPLCLVATLYFILAYFVTYMWYKVKGIKHKK